MGRNSRLLTGEVSGTGVAKAFEGMADPEGMPRLPRLLAVALGLGAAVAATDAAHADDTCARLRAEARAEAVILYAPRIELEGARAPAVIDASEPTAARDGFQARAALALSPVDMLRGRAVERVARAECALDDASHQIDRVLATGARFGELAAVRAELAYLDEHLPTLDTLVADATEALARQRATALEVDELRSRRATLRRRASDLRNTRVLLEELDGEPGPTPDLDALAATARAAAIRVDRRKADVRGLSAWRLDVRAGVAAAERADYFAVVELSYSLGERFQKSANRRAVAARTAEVANDDRSATVRLARLQQAMRDSVVILDEELRGLDEELAAIATDRARLEGLDSDAARALRNRATIATIELEARRASVSTLAQTRHSLVGGVQ